MRATSTRRQRRSQGARREARSRCGSRCAPSRGSASPWRTPRHCPGCNPRTRRRAERRARIARPMDLGPELRERAGEYRRVAKLAGHGRQGAATGQRGRVVRIQGGLRHHAAGLAQWRGKIGEIPDPQRIHLRPHQLQHKVPTRRTPGKAGVKRQMAAARPSTPARRARAAARLGGKSKDKTGVRDAQS